MIHVLRRFRRLDRTLALLLLIVLAFAGARLPWLDWFPMETFAGSARAADGDSLYVAGREVRLAGMDAPELAQLCTRNGKSWPCGQVARQELADRVAGRTVLCRVRGHDRFGRALARCEADGRDLGAAMVRAGYAVGFGDYAAQEAAARHERAGIWAGAFERPAAWRERNPRPGG